MTLREQEWAGEFPLAPRGGRLGRPAWNVSGVLPADWRCPTRARTSQPALWFDDEMDNGLFAPLHFVVLFPLSFSQI